MDLKDYRVQIDAIDDQLTKLFVERMEVARGIAEYKIANGLPVLDAGREREKLNAICAKVSPELRDYTSVLYSSLFELSRSYQNRQMMQETPLSRAVAKAVEETPKLFPRNANVAVCGVEGAYGQIACEKMFQRPQITYCGSFDAVFAAIESGQCAYGVVPIENSTAGSVKQVYDLMVHHNFHIVRATRLKVDHNLVVNKGVKLEDIREIVSHEQALSQCGAFLAALGPEVKITAVENTAMAAEMVAKSGRGDLAALCSRKCVELYNLCCLKDAVQDMGNNYTRFFCISKALEIYPGADRTSIMTAAAHKPGALYKLLGRLYALGINMTKLESRPIPERDFEFMFYLDLDASVYSEEFAQLISELSAGGEEFTYLGSYTEVV